MRCSTPADAIAAYVWAKDGNRPHLIDLAFAEHAMLEIVNRTEAIDFPPTMRGRQAIADAVVRRFALGFENVYTFCLAAPPSGAPDRLSCLWLVGMTERDAGAARVGWGRYDWRFADAGPPIERMRITIEAMSVLPPADAAEVVGWLATLPYPWCADGGELRSAPELPAVTEILRQIRAAAAQA